MNRNLINILKLVKPYQYENVLAKKTKLNNKLLEKCVKLRRNHYNINKLPYKSFNYITSFNKNCENVIGYVRMPVGLIGPVNIDMKRKLINIYSR